MVCAAGNGRTKDLHNIKYPASHPQINLCWPDHIQLEWLSMYRFSSVGEIDVLALGEWSKFTCKI